MFNILMCMCVMKAPSFFNNTRKLAIKLMKNRKLSKVKPQFYDFIKYQF